MKKILLILILFLALILRFYKLDQIPPSLNWDEAAAGYNAYTIANWGADEYGKKFPITFKNFGDDKHPIHIYLTAVIVKIFGLNDFSVRAGSAAIGVFGVFVIYFLAKKMIGDEIAGLFSALFLAVSPYAVHYSRGLWEANFALFFFMLGLALFAYGLERKNWMIPASFFSFGLSFLSYHSAKVVIPPVVLLLCILNFKRLYESRKLFIISILIGLLFVGIVVKDPKILGFARINQNKFSDQVIAKYGGLTQTYWHNYKEYFTYSYLFDKGDQSPRGSVKVIGEFYKIDLILGLIGLIALAAKRKWKIAAVIFLWLALSPVPGALTSEMPGSTRGIFMIGPVILISGLGASFLVGIFKNSWARILTSIIIVILLGFEVQNYLNYYYKSYSKKEAIEWQYGMKEMVEYVSDNGNFYKAYVDKIRQQPYIFFLYYLKTPLPELLDTVKYDESESKSYNTVRSFGQFQFGGWDPIESYPSYGILYMITPSYFTGLRYKNLFNVEKLVKYPDGTDAFYIITGYEQ